MQTQPSLALPKARTGPSVVAVVATTPETVLDDIARAMRLAGAAEALPTPSVSTGSMTSATRGSSGAEPL